MGHKDSKMLSPADSLTPADLLTPAVISAESNHTGSVIFLHGLGDTGHAFAISLKTLKSPNIKYIFPTASRIPVSLNKGNTMYSWFDLKTLDAEGPEDEESIEKASKVIYQLITDEEKKGIPSEKIVLGGFSQGGALALYTALQCTKSLAGVIALSCWLPQYKQFPFSGMRNKNIPVIQCHGDMDTIVPFKWGQMSYEHMKTFMPNIEFITYKGLCHNRNEDEIKDIKDFITRVLA